MGPLKRVKTTPSRADLRRGAAGRTGVVGRLASRGCRARWRLRCPARGQELAGRGAAPGVWAGVWTVA